MELNKKELTLVTGGGITSAMLNAISKAITTIYELGKSTGSAIRRFASKNLCPVK